jgi:preprotein translocase subunit YajC
MDTFILPLLMAAPQAGAEAAGPAGFFTSLIPFIAIILIFYLLIIRPQSKKRKETEKMLAALKKGDKVVTIGGLHGTVQAVKEQTVIIKADDNVKLEFSRTAVSNVINPAPVKEEKTEKIEEKDESGGAAGTGEQPSQTGE